VLCFAFGIGVDEDVPDVKRVIHIGVPYIFLETGADEQDENKITQCYCPFRISFPGLSLESGRGGKRPWHRLVTCPSYTLKSWV